MLIDNPFSSEGSCFAVFDKFLLLKEDGSALDFSDLCALHAHDAKSDFFEENENGNGSNLCVLSLSTLDALPDGYAVRTLREYFATCAENEVIKASRAKSLAAWRKNTRFCPACGAQLVNSSRFTARECPACAGLHFPRIEPCVIVLVSRGEKILLVRHTYRNQDIYACIAGFIEAGESAEHAVLREVKEETGLTIRNLVYKGSQSWPFPDQLMLAFTAEYESGELVLQKEEIADAKWFYRDDIPASPKPGSIAYKLIHNLFD